MNESERTFAASSPYVPLFTTSRSGIDEVIVSGIVSVVEGTPSSAPKSLIAHGDVNHMLWSRSLLKPWQLLSHFQELSDAYPALNEPHFALMMSSHSAEDQHLKLLKELMEIGSVPETYLRCPASFPLSAVTRLRLKEQGGEPKSLYHNCSGKHFGYILALKSKGHEGENYLDPQSEHFQSLKSLVRTVVHRDVHSFGDTTDGCQLPNYAMTPLEMACSYLGLIRGEETADKRTKKLSYLSSLMMKYPQLIGGSERLDFRIMSGAFSYACEIPLIAKEGADGLLGIGIGACRKYKNGLGILIKLASGGDIKHTETIAKEILRQLGLLSEKPQRTYGAPVRTDHISTKFHFELATARV